MDKCLNCGAEIGIHHYKTMQCPLGGCEAPIDKKQEWMDSIYKVRNNHHVLFSAIKYGYAECERGLSFEEVIENAKKINFGIDNET